MSDENPVFMESDKTVTENNRWREFGRRGGLSSGRTRRERALRRRLLDELREAAVGLRRVEANYALIQKARGRSVD